MREEKLITSKEFSALIRNRMAKGEGAMEAIIGECEGRDIPLEDTRRLIDVNLKALLEAEAIALNMVEGSEAPTVEGFME